MKLYKRVVIAVVLTAFMTGFAELSAKNKCVPKLYVFGFAASFNDSIIHFTEIQTIDSAWVNDKNTFLVERENYSYQLRNYLEGQGMPHRTCVVSFALKRKDILKKYAKMLSKYMKRNDVRIEDIKRSDFRFTAIKPE